MLVEACRERKIPDCEFFINKRDYPQLKVNVPRGVPVEPYGFIFDKDDRDPDQDVDLCEEHKFATYAPIFSFYAAKKDRFADIPFPSSGAKLLLTSLFADNTIPFILTCPFSPLASCSARRRGLGGSVRRGVLLLLQAHKSKRRGSVRHPGEGEKEGTFSRH